MTTYLLIWNPKKWPWDDIQDDIAQINQNSICNGRWSTGVTKKIHPGDRIFLMKLGPEPRGIMASGWVISEVFEDIHWADNNKFAYYVDGHFDTILDPEKDNLLPFALLRMGIYQKVNWTPQASGVTIPDNVAYQLEIDWAKHNGSPIPVRSISYPDDINEDGITFYEGEKKEVRVNNYERNPEARAICIKKYGATCSICGFDFSKKYGEIGEGFIHVHHLKPLSEIRKGYILDPIKELRPVCPNCHAMLHQRQTPYSIEELIEIVKHNNE